MKNDINNTGRIQTASRRFIRVLQFLVVVVPLIDCLIWGYMNDLLTPMQHEILPEYARFPLPPLALFLGWCVSLLPVSIFVYGCLVLMRLFRLYERGSIFTGENVVCFYLLSRIFMTWCLVSILIQPLQSIALTLHHPKGERIIYLSLNSVNLTILLIGGVIGVIAWVMEEARKINEEQELTI